MNVAILALLFMQATPAEGAPAAPPSPPACDSPEHAAFDFWVGEWDVYRHGTETKVAESRIERLHNGCAVREQWMPLRGAGGSSLNHFDPVTRRWHQKWVGQVPGSVEFEGGLVEGRMVLNGYWPGVGGPGRDGLVRMTYTPSPDGSVRQHGEVSYDHGLTWSDSFDFDYRRKESTK